MGSVLIPLDRVVNQSQFDRPSVAIRTIVKKGGVKFKTDHDVR